MTVRTCEYHAGPAVEASVEVRYANGIIVARLCDQCATIFPTTDGWQHRKLGT